MTQNIEESRSYAEKYSIVHKWEINDITPFIRAARLTKLCEIIRSPNFSAGAKFKDSWHLELIIGKDSELSESKSWVSLYLLSNNNKRVRAQFSIFILDNENKRRGAKLKVATNVVGSQEVRFFDNSNSGYGYKFVKIDELFEKKDELLKNDILTVCIDLIVYDDYVEVSNPINLLRGSKRKLIDDFKDLFVAKKKYDVVIKVGDESFVAHKFLLTTRSCVFDAMFSLDMKENKENKVTILDIEPEVFKKVLDYIYTDNVDELDNFAEKLLEASDKYQLQGLKEMCEDSLAKTVTAKNVISILVLADRHNAKLLKDLAINYVATNFVKLKNSEEFKALKESQSSLYFEVLEKYAMES